MATALSSRPRISIVMGYINRKKQTVFTLKTIAASSYKNIEVIIVDDGSDPEEQLQDVLSHFDFPIKYLITPKSEKTWVNPCMAYNKGIAAATGDVIVLQNPEVCHVGDVLEHVARKLTLDTYLVFSVLNANSFDNNDLLYATPLPLKPTTLPLLPNSDWYNNPFGHNPNLHFLSAISMSNMQKVGGFDENFKDGIDYDDDDLRDRIARIATIITIPPNEVMGIHLHHEKFTYHRPNVHALRMKNYNLYTRNNTMQVVYTPNSYVIPVKALGNVCA